MNTEVISNSIFQFESNKIRIIVIENEPWFVAADVCNILDYKSTYDGTRMLEEDELHTHIVRGNKGDRKVSIINESGLYALILKSRKPEARKFSKWVTSEVLPAIRKTGQYSSPSQEQNPPQEQKDPNRYIELTTDLDRNEFMLMMELYTLLPVRYRHATMEMVDIMAVTHAKSLTEFRNKLERNRLKVS